VLLLLLQLRDEEDRLSDAMLLPGVRLVERPGALHFFDGRRVVSLTGDERGRAAVRAAVDAPSEAAGGPGDAALADAREFLLATGLADDEPDHAVPDGAGYASAVTGGWTSGAVAAARLARTTVHVSVGAEDEALLSTLTRSGLDARPLADLGQVAGLDPARELVVVAAPPNRPATVLHAANEACLAAGVSWLPLGVYDGARLPVGPLVVPGQSACYACAQRRCAANVTYAGLFDDLADAAPAPTPDAVRTWAHALAALVLVHWIAGRDAQVPGRLYTVVPDEFGLRSAAVLRVPRCAACGAPDYLPAAAPWGTHRDH
jgi:bacteriocin biosynthesis cyclodehydratase domain-containing protein